MAKTKLSLPAKMNVILGKLVYKNGANFTNNFKGRKKWNANKNNFTQNIKSSEYMQHLHENGFTQPTVLFNEDLIKDVANEFNAIIENKKHTDFRDKFGGINTEHTKDFISSYWIKNPLQSMPSIKKLFTPEFVNLLHSYYQSEFKLHSIDAWKTVHVPNEILEDIYPAAPYSLHWHTDGHTIDTTKLFMVLSDVTEDNGPFHFLSKPRTSELFKKGFINRFISIGMHDEIESKGLHKLTGKSGTAAFCNTPVCLHRAGIPAKGQTRSILQFRFESANKPFNANEL